MMVKIDNISINYTRYENRGKKSILFLHGWGQNIQMMEPIAKPFIDDFDITIIDLPGFGLSDTPDSIWTIYDYAKCINKLCKELDIVSPILVGHSFGGKVALAYASMYDVSKLILFASPFRKGIEKLSLKTKMLKKLKKVPGLDRIGEIAKKYIGSTDYKNASPLMREILVEHVNLDISNDIKKIKAPTLIVWGTLDSAVDVSEAYVLESLIKDAGVVIFEGCTHYAYLENLGGTINVMNSFLRS